MDQAPTLEALQANLAQIESTLSRTRRQLQEAQQLSHIGSWEWDVASGEVWWSDQLYRIYGLEPQSRKPSYEGFLDFVHPDDRESVDERNRRAFADHQPFEDVKRVVRADGRMIRMRTRGEVITDDAGEVARLVGICEDVTERPSTMVGTLDRPAMALQLNDEVVQPLNQVSTMLARGEIDEAATALEGTLRRARRLAEELMSAPGKPRQPVIG